MSPSHATKSRIYLVRKVEGLLCKIKKIAEQSGRIGLARPKEKPPGRDAGSNWSVGPSFWAGSAKQELGRCPLTERWSRSEEDGGDGAAGGGFLPWKSRRRHERAREMALDTADASPRSIWASPELKRLGSGRILGFSGEGFRTQSIFKSAKSRPNFSFLSFGFCLPSSELYFCFI
ncbi:hypothetical protein CDL15_Pgr014961 [Punica granatum]|uniref:Uncharacterized protein n=1 Tax=Punica granatum TaxID=22663 RepID=A0A218X1C4_PUNGR|nr:hypothetical protein CDL15_Pgr014961 [Punica granatum]